MENWLSQLTMWMWLYSCWWGHIISSGLRVSRPCCRASRSMQRSFGARVLGCRAYRLVSSSFKSTNWTAGETRYQGRQSFLSRAWNKGREVKEKVAALLREAALVKDWKQKTKSADEHRACEERHATDKHISLVVNSYIHDHTHTLISLFIWWYTV